MDFGRGSAPGCTLGAASGLGGGVAERKSFKSRNFLIISCRENILLLCLAWIEVTVIAIADVIALAIDCWRKESIVQEAAMISAKQATASGNLFMFVNQLES